MHLTDEADYVPSPADVCAPVLSSGMGRQTWVVWVNIVGFWVIGTPAGAVLTFVADLGVDGLWWGLAIGLFCISVLYAVVLARVNWEGEARAALQRVTGSDSSEEVEQEKDALELAEAL